jgi:hypothetical protein
MHRTLRLSGMPGPGSGACPLGYLAQAVQPSRKPAFPAIALSAGARAAVPEGYGRRRGIPVRDRRKPDHLHGIGLRAKAHGYRLTWHLVLKLKVPTNGRVPLTPRTTRSLVSGGTVTSKANGPGRIDHACGPDSSVQSRPAGTLIACDRSTMTSGSLTVPPAPGAENGYDPHSC